MIDKNSVPKNVEQGFNESWQSPHMSTTKQQQIFPVRLQ